MKKNVLIIFVIGLLALGSIGFYLTIKKTPKGVVMSSFEECVAQGNAVMESYPRQCRDASGTLFVEKIAEEITYVNATSGIITVTAPLPNSSIESSFTVTGKARGYWFFEASFPVRALDKDGNTLALAPAQALSDWMTTEYVPFSVTLQIPDSYVGPVTLVLSKDNPSGLPENDASISFGINKQSSSNTATTTIKLYYYNPKLDQGEGGVQCTEKGLVAVDRTIPKTISPIQDAIRALIKGELTVSEEARGLETEYPLEGFALVGASLSNGDLLLTFDDPKNKATGGSCRTALLWRQIEATAKQFKEVTSVKFLPEDLFQP